MVEEFEVPITFDPENNTFHGKKHKYKILSTLPVCRYRELGIVEHELSFGCGVNDLITFSKSVYNNINKGTNVAENAVNAYKLMESLQDIKERVLPMFKLIDLYTVKAGGSLEDFGGEHLKEKMEDWALIDTNFFLALSIRLIPSYLQGLRQLSQSISQ